MEKTEKKKYEITEIAHPEYPWLHRIRALVPVNQWVMKGDLGGFVESENNLSQEGLCWIYDDAISCEDAVVEKNAVLFMKAMARDSALITNNAGMYEQSVAEGCCCILNGELKDDARVAGKAMVKENEVTGQSPIIAGNSHVYGFVSGNYIIKGLVKPGEEFSNPTKDMFIFEDGKWDVLTEVRELRVPEGFQKQKKDKNKQHKGNVR